MMKTRSKISPVKSFFFFSPIPNCMAYSILIQATLAVDFDVGFAIKEKVKIFIAFLPLFIQELFF